MGYLDGTTIVVDAILTKKGREILASGTNNFNIKMFALADDEIDYALWNPNHTLGANYYGEAIENLPILEAIADDSIMMKYKLITLPYGSTHVPTIFVTPTEFILPQGGTVDITPGTDPISTQNYTAILNNSTDFSIVAITANNPPSPPSSDGNLTAIGTKFRVSNKNVSQSSRYCVITISGIETGDTITVSGEALGITSIGH